MTALIHPTAVIHPSAELHPTVEVGAYAVIGEQVAIGARSTVGAHAVIEGPTVIGVDNRIFPGAAIGLEPQDLKYRGGSSWVKIGDGNTIREYVTVNRATDSGEVTAIGNENLLMAYVHVAHNCEIANGVVIANNVALAGHVCIEEKATIGGMLGIHQFVRIGRLAMVGGMSRVDRDVPPFMLVEGNPARVRALNTIGIQRHGLNDREIAELKQAFRLLYRSNLSLETALEKLAQGYGMAPLVHLHEFLHQSSTETGRRGPVPAARH
ncbi:acyl-[acyl-carrier-protein]--UDP-N-acetylglucosamine O-acyltransferase [Rubidibacter lacunae KORDI 51-2]|uniref:Acyl-[acyl-carrier-protein]--UDP-N-acetylglucosamine O-acyltransferase n=1 Tax=Rubidibacter lacunae KORDI 51-2 TaxID=582515 RepID=U5DRL9_9CHRO|nr:acyl-ACP--UDP-N-acetylglucosamine O-acyltransferase [Rubidibacter lacunae]ERN42340.1 acyl-[acyl-carrier-protein]--UDP-N-acetylglucosamine O-acyltransferase [Rubidibacter lacunae KORDI 51-2]